MESRHCGTGKGRNRRFGFFGWRSRSGRHLLILAFWLLCSAVLGMGSAHAQSTSYVYDANGRVVAVTATNGTSVPYIYNALGHISQVGAPPSPGQLAIFAFAPTHGVAGTQVTMDGQGFSSVPASNTVSFCL